MKISEVVAPKDELATEAYWSLTQADDKIDAFCKLRYDTKFPRFAKIKVNGSGESELYTYLKSVHSGRIKWNFTKFLVARDGTVVARYASAVKPEKIEDALVAELTK